MNTHYVCTGGCKGVSDDPKAICQAPDCSHHKHPLVACHCTDGHHREAYDMQKEMSK